MHRQTDTNTPEGFSYGVQRNSLPSNAKQYVRGESQLLVCIIKQGDYREEVYIQLVFFWHGKDGEVVEYACVLGSDLIV